MTSREQQLRSELVFKKISDNIFTTEYGITFLISDHCIVLLDNDSLVLPVEKQGRQIHIDVGLAWSSLSPLSGGHFRNWMIWAEKFVLMLGNEPIFVGSLPDELLVRPVEGIVDSVGSVRGRVPFEGKVKDDLPPALSFMDIKPSALRFWTPSDVIFEV